MQVWHAFPSSPLPGAWVTVGGFDGMHLGHQQLIHRVLEHARAQGLHAVVVTFDPLPAVFFGRRPARYLTPVPEKLALLEALGVDVTLLLPFDRELATTEAEAFVQRLRHELGMVGLVCGPDFALGRGRRGDVARLRVLARDFGFTLEVLEEVHNGGLRISASRVRQALGEGDVALAAALLGRPYLLYGPVQPGAGRGRRIGISTANVLPPEEKWLPREGVYAGWAFWPGERTWLPAAANLGRRPTFADLPRPLLEVHLLDRQDGPDYGQTLFFAFVQRLREERRFPTVDALRRQIARDIQQAKEVLAHAHPPSRVPAFFPGPAA